ncbi:hypothetical protein MPL3356_270045 [Mesorhizobium plurifarium]|uniref:Uncharacterized protein n=1 Tax=Mesorhizobium plurifarium TaxID=69974 RepID=A0A090DV84_MESPL|nr:hypothetical protein MPL3356_270045 [Mesorhizobium plurifarium]
MILGSGDNKRRELDVQSPSVMAHRQTSVDRVRMPYGKCSSRQRPYDAGFGADRNGFPHRYKIGDDP